MAIEPITEEEATALLEVRNGFYKAYSRLVNQTLKKVPGHLQELCEVQLQEMSNLYSRDEKL